MKFVWAFAVLSLTASMAAESAQAALMAPIRNDCANLVAQYRAIRQTETEARIHLARAAQPPQNDMNNPKYREALDSQFAIQIMNRTPVTIELEEIEKKLAQACPAPALTKEDAKRHYQQLKSAGVQGLERWQQLEK